MAMKINTGAIFMLIFFKLRTITRRLKTICRAQHAKEKNTAGPVIIFVIPFSGILNGKQNEQAKTGANVLLFVVFILFMDNQMSIYT